MDDEERGGEAGSEGDGDTFRVGIHVTEEDLQFVVRVPSDIDSGWTDPESFQRLVEAVVWDRLDRESVLRSIATRTPTGETVLLGSVTLRPDGTVVEYELEPPAGPGSD
ncbi:MAG: hypothetical protein ABEJ28_03215 [Salinigranum sp.]